ncbi:MAG: glycosyltransferase involved in cell wall biosynthesis [Cryomorphaceae bacterium]|jgi:glycosyltransferase involved in cell wall biosynthesis
MLDQITPVILTFNEQANIERTLKALSWAADVLVVDSYSTDKTLKLCAQFSNVRVVQNTFESAAKQCNFALEQNIRSDWVLSMDADYVVTDALREELNTLTPSSITNGYNIRFTYLVRGRRLFGSLYPPRTCLYRKQFAHYIQDGHTQRVRVKGDLGDLRAKINHDDRKPYARWLSSQKRYAKLEARKLAQSSWSQLSWPNKIRASGLAPVIIVPYTLLGKKLILSGPAGLEYTWRRLVAEVCLQKARFKQRKDNS